MTAPTPKANGPPADAAGEYQSQRLADGQACLKAALDLLTYGCPVLALCPPDHAGMSKNHRGRCKSHGKAPWHCWAEFQPDGRGRLPTGDEVSGWWLRHPTSNLGLALGKQVRIDVEGPEAQERLAGLARGDLPATWEFASGREDGTGRGLLYQLPAGEAFRTRKEGLELGGELRLQALGAQTVLPPSRHRSGRLYTWTPGHAPEDVGIADAPAWLLEALRQGCRTKAPPRQPRAAGVSGARDAAPALEALAALKPWRASGYDDWLRVGMALHSVSDDDAMLAAWDEWSKQCREKYEDGACETKWATFSPDGGITLGSLIRWAREDGWVRHAKAAAGGNGDGHQGAPRPAGQPRTGARPAPPAEGPAYEIGGLTLRPGGPAKQTAGGRLSLQLHVFRGGVLLAKPLLNNTRAGLLAAMKDLRLYSDQARGDEVLRQLARILAEAPVEQKAGAPAGGALVRDVVRLFAKRLRVTHRTKRGLWSEARKAELTKGDVLSFLPPGLFDEAAGAANAPREGNDGRLLADIKVQLELLYGEWMEALPDAPQAKIEPGSEAARCFRAALVTLWTATRTFEVSKGGAGGGETASRTSMARRALGAAEKVKGPGVKKPSQGWNEVQRAFNGWWRVAEVEVVGGELKLQTVLGMRWELAHQVGVALPGVTDQQSFQAIAKASGCLHPTPPVPDRLTGGHRLCVLADDLRGEILTVASTTDPTAEGDAREERSDTLQGV